MGQKNIPVSDGQGSRSSDGISICSHGESSGVWADSCIDISSDSLEEKVVSTCNLGRQGISTGINGASEETNRIRDIGTIGVLLTVDYGKKPEGCEKRLECLHIFLFSLQRL